MYLFCAEMQIREMGGILSTLQNESHPSPTCLRRKRMLSYNELSVIKSFLIFN